MKKMFLIVLFFFPVILCFSQTGQTGCSAFKTGKFMYHDSTNNIIMVTRKGKRQTEYDAKNDITTKLKLKWISDCEYQLTQIWSNSKAKRKQNKTVSRVMITKVNSNDSYDYDCGCKDPAIKMSSKGTMVRIKK
jgi:hypothetical protein